MSYERKPAQPFGAGRERTRRRRPADEEMAYEERPSWQQQHVPTEPRRAEPQHDNPHYTEEFDEPAPRRQVYRDDDGEGMSGMGALVFLLIFGVGNYFLYKYTGWLIIPIPRR